MCVCVKEQEKGIQIKGEKEEEIKRETNGQPDTERNKRATRYREEGRKREIEGGGNEEETGDE